jgi:hypothetical protein
MAGQPEPFKPGRSVIKMKIGNPLECRQAISAAIAKRAYEIYQRRGRGPGRECEDWRLAEQEVLRTLSCCGIVDSKDQMDISVLSSALSSNAIEKIEICVEPHRVIFIGKTTSASHKEGRAVYRVLPLKEEVDPLTVSLTQKGCLFEIKLRKVRKELDSQKRAA